MVFWSILSVFFVLLFFIGLDDNLPLVMLSAGGIILSLCNVFGRIDQKLDMKEFHSSEYKLEYKVVTIEEHGVETKDTIYVLTKKDLVENLNN